MNWDSVTVGNLLTIAGMGIMGLVAYFGWQRAVDRKFSLVEQAFQRQYAAMDQGFDTKFATMDKSFDNKFSALSLQINTIMMRDVEGMRGHISALERDSVGLHQRVHDLSDVLHNALLDVDRLKRPHA